MDMQLDEEAIQRRHDIDDLFIDTFNAVLRTEEAVLGNKLTYGLTITEIHTIVAVGLDESNPMNVVAARLNVTLATLTTAVNKLVEKGYIDRKRGEKDRRQVLIHLTSDGKRVYRAHNVFHHNMIDDALQGLTPEEEVVLARSLNKIRDFFNEQAASASNQDRSLR